MNTYRNIDGTTTLEHWEATGTYIDCANRLLAILPEGYKLESFSGATLTFGNALSETLVLPTVIAHAMDIKLQELETLLADHRPQ